MSDERVNLCKVSPELRERMRDLKRDGETWGGLISRAADALEETERRGGQQGPPICTTCGQIATTWTLIDGNAHCEECADVDFGIE